MANNITPEMIALLNSGNKAELRAFLKLYTRPVYERALAITKSEEDAIRVTRRVTSEVSVLALRGKLEEDIDAQLMALTDACCSEDMFFARLVEDTLRDYPEEKRAAYAFRQGRKAELAREAAKRCGARQRSNNGISTEVKNGWRTGHCRGKRIYCTRSRKQHAKAF